MKRYICFCIALLLVVCCSACSNNDKTDPTETTTPTVGDSTQPTSPTINIPTEPAYKPMFNWEEKEEVSFPDLPELVFDPATGYISTPFTLDVEQIYQALVNDSEFIAQFPNISRGQQEKIIYLSGVAGVYYTHTITCASADNQQTAVITLERNAAQYANYHKVTLSLSGLTEDFEQENVRSILGMLSEPCLNYALYGKDTDGKMYEYAETDNDRRGNLTQWGNCSLSESVKHSGYEYFIVRRFSKTQQLLMFSIGIDKEKDIVVPDTPVQVGAAYRSQPRHLDDIVSSEFGVSDPLDTANFANELIQLYTNDYKETVVKDVYVIQQPEDGKTRYQVYVKFGYKMLDGTESSAVFEIAFQYLADDIGNISDPDYGFVFTNLPDASVRQDDISKARETEYEKIISMVTALFAHPNTTKMHYVDNVPSVVNSVYANILGQRYEERTYVKYTDDGITVTCNQNLVKEIGR